MSRHVGVGIHNEMKWKGKEIVKALMNVKLWMYLTELLIKSKSYRE